MAPKNELLAEVRAYCEAHANPAGADRWRRYFKEGFDAWGLLSKTDPLWTVKRPEWSARYSKLGLHGFLSLGEHLFSSGKYEEGALAIQFVCEYKDRLDTDAIEALDKWFASGLANWAHTDVLCAEILSPLLASRNVNLRTIAKWRTSRFKFQRRAVPVALLGRLKSESRVEALLCFLAPMMMDTERVVQQGLGWFLREAWKRHPKPVESFLLEWSDRAPRVIFQYATEKMTPEQKARFRRPAQSHKRRSAAASG